MLWAGHITDSSMHVIDIAMTVKDLSAHILRHSNATNLAKFKYSLAEIKYLMGHSTAALALEIYTHIETEDISANRLNGVKLKF